MQTYTEIPTTNKRRIDFPLFTNTTIIKNSIHNPIGKSDHKTLLVDFSWKHSLTRKTLLNMSRTFLAAELKGVNRTCFRGLDD